MDMSDNNDALHFMYTNNRLVFSYTFISMHNTLFVLSSHLHFCTSCEVSSKNSNKRHFTVFITYLFQNVLTLQTFNITNFSKSTEIPPKTLSMYKIAPSIRALSLQKQCAF